MIPAHEGYEAQYKARTKDHPASSVSTNLPVEAWDDDGNAHVASRRGLIRADRIEGFIDVDLAENSSIVAAIPGLGWKVRTSGKEKNWEEPVIAWIIERSGWSRPITPTGDGPGDIQATEPFGGDYLLIPPTGAVKPGQEVVESASNNNGETHSR